MTLFLFLSGFIFMIHLRLEIVDDSRRFLSQRCDIAIEISRWHSSSHIPRLHVHQSSHLFNAFATADCNLTFPFWKQFSYYERPGWQTRLTEWMHSSSWKAKNIFFNRATNDCWWETNPNFWHQFSPCEKRREKKRKKTNISTMRTHDTLVMSAAVHTFTSRLFGC